MHASSEDGCLTSPIVWRPERRGRRIGVCISALLAACALSAGGVPGAGAAGADGGATLHRVRTLHTPAYARIVLDLDRRVEYEVHRLDADPEAGRPPRLYIDLFRTRCAREVPARLDLEQGPVRCVRAGHFDADTGRLVLELRQAERYKVFGLADPDRIVLDLWWDDAERTQAGSGREGRGERASREALPLIVLDPGHGGVDPGAVGRRGLKEKDVVFSISLRLKRALETRKLARVMLTRDTDRFVRLEKRTRFANEQNADLFVSIHANANPVRKVRGVETYYLDNTTDKASIRLAALENKTAERPPTDLQRILQDLRLGSNARESYNLAHVIQRELVSGLSARYDAVRDLGAKGNLFYVLIGAHMPSVLVEVAFISNPAEEKRLRSPAYLDRIAEGMADGIEAYLEQPGSFRLIAGHAAGG